MSKNDFTRDEFDTRRVRVREELCSAQLDWLIAFHPVSIHWLTGAEAKSYQELQCLLIGAQDDRVVVLTRESDRNEFEDDAWVDDLWTHGGREPEDPVDVFERVVEAYGLRGARIGMEVPAYYLHAHHYCRIKSMLGEALVAEPTNLVHDLKLVKSPAEISLIRQASRNADVGMEAFRVALSIGRSEFEVAGDIYRALFRAGSGLAASPINLVSGERSGFSHGAPTHRTLRRGDFGSVEFGATFRWHTATIGRQFAIGAPTARMRELYDVVRRAADAYIAAVADGVPAIVPHEAAQRVIADAGLDHGRVHTSGYGLAPGFPPTWGEPMHLFGGSSYILRAGMVVTVEPPVFLGSERLGARLIDNLLITENGAELLSRESRDLIVID
jgi:Xaa-Pro dipeptidase